MENTDEGKNTVEIEKGDANYNVSIKAFVFNEDGKLLLLKASGVYGEDKWELPGGVVDSDEVDSPLEEVLGREVAEECGPDFQVETGQLATVNSRGPRGQFGPLLLIGYTCRYGGGGVELSGEHTEFAWADINNLDSYPLAKGTKEMIASYQKRLADKAKRDQDK